MSTPSPAPIVVLGAGVIGLTTAVRLLESKIYTKDNHPVHVIADHLPNDPLDAYYASTIAGAHHLSFADDNDERQKRWDRDTFKIMYEEWKTIGEKSGLMVLTQTELYVGTDKHLAIYEEHPDFTVLDPRTVSSLHVDHTIAFTSLTMTPSTYLNRLLDRISQLGGHVHRAHLPSLSSLYTPPIAALIGTTPPKAVLVCVGIGALTLGGVEDTTVFPTRGQVIKVRAPWIRSGWTRQIGSLDGGEGGERTYVIPRPDGDVILGGTREIDDWYPYPREETKIDILRRAMEICPLLSPAYKQAPKLASSSSNSSSSETSIEKGIGTISLSEYTAASMASTAVTPLEEIVTDHLVGFRPSRKAGVRLERGQDVKGTAVIYNYGHGGAGWQSCWGTASDAVDLVLDL